MKYKFTGNGIIDLNSTNVSTDDKRWQLLSPYQMGKLFPKNNWGWFNEILYRENEITSLALGFDKFIERPVIAKTVNYRLSDLDTINSINERRKVLIEQVRILNDLKGPLLPEILDWITVENIHDPIKYEECRYNEPLLIFDYIPGISMSWSINSGKFRRSAKGNGERKDSIFEEEYSDLNDVVDVQKIGRVALKILYFIKYLSNREYTNMALSPDHVLLLKDDTPRFLGIGRICKTINGKVDLDHINSSKTLYGYSAPELNDWVTGRRKNADGKKICLFSLGVLIHQMVIGTTEFHKDMLNGPSFCYPNPVSEPLIYGKGKDGRTLHNLISKLCCHNENERLSDMDEIEKELRLLSRMYISGEEGKKTVIPDLIGTVRTFNSDKLFGDIECESGKIYKFNPFSINSLSRESREAFRVGTKVKFEGTDKPDVLGRIQSYANEIKVIERPSSKPLFREVGRELKKTPGRPQSKEIFKDYENNQAENVDKKFIETTLRKEIDSIEEISERIIMENAPNSRVKKNTQKGYHGDLESWRNKIADILGKTMANKK